MLNIILMKSFKDILPNIIKVTLFLGLGLLFVWLSVKDLSEDDVNIIFSSMRLVNNPQGWLFITLSALSLMGADTIRSFRARQMLVTNGYRPRVSMTFYSVMVCYLANLAVPRLGEILRCTFLQRYENIPFQKSLGTVILERTIDLMCWLLLFIIAFSMNTTLLSQIVVNQETGVTLQEWFRSRGMNLIGNHTLFLLMGAFALFVAILALTKRYWQNNRFMIKVLGFLKEMWRSFISVKDMKRPWLFLFWTVAMWVLYFFGTYFFFFSLPYLRHVGPAAAFTVLVFGTIAFMVSQGGLGSYPLITAGITLLYGISYPQGLAAGWIGWLLQTAVALVIGLLTLAVVPLYQRRDSQITKENDD